jgi:hypothetical protein
LSEETWVRSTLSKQIKYGNEPNNMTTTIAVHQTKTDSKTTENNLVMHIIHTFDFEINGT